MAVTAIVLAAGEGTRMRSARAKVLHEVLDRPMVCWVVDAARDAGVDRIIVVVGNDADQVSDLFADDADVMCVLQEERLGTGHAVRIALEQAGITDGQVLLLCGDTPLLSSEMLADLIERAKSAPGGALLTMCCADPFGYGRVMVDEDGMAERIVEQKDCTAEEAACDVCNAGVYCFDAAALAEHINDLTRSIAQAEYYITDMIAILYDAGSPLAALACGDDPDELMGVNSRIHLARATKAMQRRINERHMAAGVTMLDPDQVWIGPNVEIGRDTEILPGTMLWGDTRIGERCVIGPQTRLTDTQVGSGSVVDETVAREVTIGNNVNCGPRAYLREGTVMRNGSKAGTHVEIKKSTIGENSWVPHLSYIGDTTVGDGVNIGAGTITCNYDGRDKHATSIGDNAFIGSDTMLVAPVSVGAGCTTGAGSVITEDVPDGALAVERSEERIIPGWLPRWRREEQTATESAEKKTSDTCCEGETSGNEC